MFFFRKKDAWKEWGRFRDMASMFFFPQRATSDRSPIYPPAQTGLETRRVLGAVFNVPEALLMKSERNLESP